MNQLKFTHCTQDLYIMTKNSCSHRKHTFICITFKNTEFLLQTFFSVKTKVNSFAIRCANVIERRASIMIYKY